MTTDTNARPNRSIAKTAFFVLLFLTSALRATLLLLPRDEGTINEAQVRNVLESKRTTGDMETERQRQYLRTIRVETDPVTGESRIVRTTPVK